MNASYITNKATITPNDPLSAYILLKCLGLSQLEIEIYYILSHSRHYISINDITGAINKFRLRRGDKAGSPQTNIRRTTLHRTVVKLEKMGFIDPLRLVWVAKYRAIPLHTALPSLHTAQRRALEPLLTQQQRMATKSRYY